MTPVARQRGFTLVELMVAIAILAILSSAAAVSMKRQQDPGDVATRLATRVRECVRLAVAGGPVRSDVLASLGSRARARLVLSAEPDGSQLVEIELLQEADLPSDDAVWARVSSSTISGKVRVAGTTAASTLDLGDGPGAAVTSDVVLECTPSGTTDARTFYLGWDGSESERSRVVVMPMTGEPIILAGW